MISLLYSSINIIIIFPVILEYGQATETNENLTLNFDQAKQILYLNLERLEANKEVKWSILDIKDYNVALKIKRILSYLDEIFEIAKVISEEFVLKQKEILKEQALRIIELLDRPQKEAERLGLDISDCLDEKFYTIEDLPEDVTDLIEVCIVEHIKNLETFMTGLKDNVNSKYSEIAELLKNYDECDSSSEKENCHTSWLARINKVLDELSQVVSEANLKSDEYLLTFEQYSMPLCSTGGINEATLTGESMLSEIALCLETNYPQLDIKHLGRTLNDGLFLKSSLLVIINTIPAQLMFYSFLNK